VGAAERDEWLRAAWRVMVAQQIDPEWLLFIDEMGANTSLHSLYAWSKRGERACCSAPRNRGKNTTLLASMTLEGMGPSLAVTGSVNTTVFEAYLKQVLLPHLRPGGILVMDNLSAHKSERVRELIEAAGCEVLYLPPYSPDFNPIEEAFSKIKNLLRTVQARSREALVEAMGKALDAITARDVRGFFEHCGYRALVQPF
jgi:transposase